jgi:hypothetical protein
MENPFEEEVTFELKPKWFVWTTGVESSKQNSKYKGTEVNIN